MRRLPDSRAARIGVVAVITTIGAVYCDDGPLYPENMAVFEVEVAGERFRIGLTAEAQIERAESLLASGAANNVHGTLRRGSGRFNAPYSWHLDPATVTFPDLSMEVCDGRPRSDVESDVDYWVDTVKYYCPWGAKIIARGLTAQTRPRSGELCSFHATQNV
jgi:hypothetical protein